MVKTSCDRRVSTVKVGSGPEEHPTKTKRLKCAHDTVDVSAAQIAGIARAQFSFFDIDANHEQTEVFPAGWAFFENAGGSQVPRQVTREVVTALSGRWRDVVGAADKKRARAVFSLLLGASTRVSHQVFLGCNASSLLRLLAQKFESTLKPGDEVVVCEMSHEVHWS